MYIIQYYYYYYKQQKDMYLFHQYVPIATIARRVYEEQVVYKWHCQYYGHDSER